MSHHPSCKPHHKELVWHCTQCGENEFAEPALDEARAQGRREAFDEAASLVTSLWCQGKEFVVRRLEAKAKEIK